MRLSTTALALFLFAAPAFAQQADRVVDPRTGEPVPLGLAPPPADAPPLRGDDLEPIQYLAAGATKLVRVNGDALLFQDGGLLISAEVVGSEVVELDRYVLPAQPSDMVVQGGLAYVPLRKNEGLLILDVSDPADLQEVGVLPGHDLLSVAVAGGYAYVGLGFSGVAVYDVSDPANPSVVTTFDTPGSANGTWVEGSTLYVADGNATNDPEFHIYDVSTPASPTLLGSFETGAFVTYVAVEGDVAYLAGNFGLRTVDVSDPSAPVGLGAFSAGGDTTYEIDLQGDLAYISGLAGLFVVDVSDPSVPTQHAAYPIEGQGLSTAAIPGAPLAFLGDRYEGLRLIDFTVPSAPVQTAFYENGGFAHKLFFDGDYLYVTDLGGRLRIVDVSDVGGAGAFEVGRLDVPSNTQEVLVRDGLAYVTDADFGGTGLTIVDVSDPANPTVVGSYGSPNQVFGLDLVGTTLFLANGFSGLQTLDVSNPAVPVPLDSFPMGSNTIDVMVEGDVAYVVNFGGGMYALDVSDPADLVQLDAEPGWGFLNALDLSILDAATAYVADGQNGLRYVDRSDPTDLQTTAITPVSSQARDVAVAVSPEEGSLIEEAFVAGDFYGIYQLRGGALVGQFESGDRGIGVAARTPGSGPTDLIALAGGEAGVYLFAGAGQAAVTLAAEALNSPVPAGGRLRFGVAVTNNTDGPLTGDLVLDVVGPGGVGATRTLISGGTLGAGATATLVFRLRVPASAPAGPYDATVTALTGGDGFETTFSFEVVGDALASGGAAGEGFEVEVLDDGGLVAAAAPSEAPALEATVAPNPMRGAGVVRYALPEAGRATLAVYDVLGRRVATLRDGLHEAGAHEVRLDADRLGLSGGVYVLRLDTDAGSTSSTVTVLR
ncbi:MAG TPA: T9SS type A sorting domain-containing protein [Rubricoccaceae bacterium]|nr:T9SS type A sorting domain-containing protein [Rubricoccaceae bacterium]